MEPSVLIEKWFWLVMILVYVSGLVNMHVRIFFQKEPRRKAIIRVLNAYYIGLIILYAIMGTGVLIGDIPTIFHYFRPQDGDPFVLAFFASIFIMWIFCFYWIFFCDGAQTLATYPGVFTRSENPSTVKLQMILVLIGGIAIFFMLFWLDLFPYLS